MAGDLDPHMPNQASGAPLLRYLGMLVGRPQNILSVSLRVKENAGVPNILQVYWSTPPRREPSKERGEP